MRCCGAHFVVFYIADTFSSTAREAAGAEESSSKVDRGDFMQLQAAYFRAEAELKSRGVYEADRGKMRSVPCAKS